MPLTEVPPAAVAVVEHYLATLYGLGPDPAAHVETCATGALVLVGSEVRRREDVDAWAYAEALTEALEALGDSRPRFELVEAIEVRVGGDRAAIRARLIDVPAAREFEAVFVLADDGILGAAVLEARAGAPDPAVALALIVAEFAQVPHSPCLGSLDLSVARVFAPSGTDLRWLPEARFSCAMCGESCRASKWRNVVSPATRTAIEAIPWNEVRPGGVQGPLFVPSDERYEMAARDDGWCAFYDTEEGCVIHRLLGRQPIAPCHEFPFGFTGTPDGVDVWTTFHCHAALNGLGTPFADREADIRSRLWAIRSPAHSVGSLVPFLPEGPFLGWSDYRLLEDRLLDAISADHGATIRAGEELLTEFGGRGVPRKPSGTLVDGLVAGIMARYATDAEARALPPGGLAGVLADLGPAPAEDGRLAVFYLRHLVFQKLFLEEFGILVTWRLGLLMWEVVRRYAHVLERLERRQAPVYQRAIQLAERLVVHSGQPLPGFLLRQADGRAFLSGP